MWIRDYLHSHPKKVKIVTNPRLRSNSMNDGETLQSELSNVLNQAMDSFKLKLNDVIKDVEQKISEQPVNPFLNFKLDTGALNNCFSIKA